jgi:hypothetical protein
VDRKSIGLNRVTEQQLPVAVEVKGGRSASLELSVTPGATLSGAVTVAPAESATDNETRPNAAEACVVGDPRQNGQGPAQPGLPNLLVELRRGDEVTRRVTDRQGAFLFEGLRPGQWHLKVYPDGLPEYHRLTTPEVDLQLESGQSKEVVIKVVPVVRRIKMIDGGEVK